MENKLYIVGEINAESYKAFSEGLTELEAEGAKDVFVELSSGGGYAVDALSFASRMRLSPCHITVRAYGLVASAAVLVLAAADYAEMAAETWVMVHEDSSKLNGDVSTLERQVMHMRRIEDQWAHLLEVCTTTPKEVWAKLHKEETYLNPEQCLELKLVDKIL